MRAPSVFDTRHAPPADTAGQAAEQIAAEQRKRTSTIQARLALRGYVLVESHTERGDAEWIVSFQSLCKAFASLDELEAWLLTRVEGRRA